jgi:hypothetical protein
MIQQDKITSGYDVEFLIGKEYLRFLLLSLFETGTIPWYSVSEKRDEDGNFIKADTIILHPPPVLEQNRLYPVHPDFIGHENPYVPDVSTYSWWQDDISVEFLFDDPLQAIISLKVYPTLVTNSHDPQLSQIVGNNSAPLHINTKLEITTAQPDDQGLISDIKLKIEVVDIHGPLLDTALLLTENGQPIYTKPELLEQTKSSVDRTMSLPLGNGEKIQAFQWALLPGNTDVEPALAFYINLALKNSPTTLLGNRGDHLGGQNFLPAGSNMAFGISSDTFPRLALDFFHRLAKENPDEPGEYYYPIERDGKVEGRFKNVNIFPDFVSNTNPNNNTTTISYLNKLVVELEGELDWDNLPDPDFRVRVRLQPINEYNEEYQKNVMTFRPTFDVEITSLAEALIYIGELVLAFVFPKVGVPLFIATMIGESVIEHYAEEEIKEDVEENKRLSFLNTLPHKLRVEKRRWDPLYHTIHQVEMEADWYAVNNYGLAFSAGNLFVGKRFEPLTNMVIRKESRDADSIMNGVYYRAEGFNPATVNFQAVYPAVDRMPYEGLLPATSGIHSVDPHLRVLLTYEQAAERLAAAEKHLKDIPYTPQKIHIDQNQIERILAISDQEKTEIKSYTTNVLTAEVKATHDTVFLAAAENELFAETGVTPTTEEIRKRANEMIARAVKALFDDRFKIEFERRMTLDLEPAEFALLQQKHLLVLGKNWLEIRERDEVPYYRDIPYNPDPEPEENDNLMELPRY